MYIDVSANPKSGHHSVEISIRDSGIGIPSDRLSAIFNEFEQVENACSRMFEGTGLGLAISRKLTGLMDGSISATSELGEGSAFCVRIPLEESLVKLAEPATQPIDLAGLRVLVVDDLELNRRIMSERLTTWGMKVKLAECGQEALTILEGRNSDFDVLILDFQMPGMDGEELARRLRKIYQHTATPLIILSSLDHSLSISSKHEIGRCELLQKPVRSEHLRLTLSRVLRAGPNLEEKPKTVPPMPDHIGKKVLIAEDNKTNQLIVKSMLKTTNIDMEFAANGQHAYEKFMALQPDLILMDMSMPVMDGLSATIAIREFEQQQNLRRCPIIALTANAMKEDQDRCFSAGMDGFVSKPIKKLELIETIDYWTEPRATGCSSGANGTN
mgnify:CR=1 FL=1